MIELISSVAFYNKNNKGYNGTGQPWIDCHSLNLEEAKNLKFKLINEGYKKVTLFDCLNLNDLEQDENIDWNYINNHIIE